MKGDYTRWTFDARKHYSSVRLQQGRVLLDADWNEQQDISEYRETTANKEIIGDGGSADLESFKVESISSVSEKDNKIELGKGICYVEGILCENKAPEEEKVTEKDLILEKKKEDGKDYIIYLEVWQHHRTAIEDENLREKALGGPDTTTRTQTYWQVKGKELTEKSKWLQKWEDILSAKSPKGKLQVKSTAASLGNDLYRVEIHKVNGQTYDGTEAQETTFKWASNNGAIAARVETISSDGKTVTIKRNPQAQFEEKKWIEITSEERELAGLPGYFAKIDSKDDKDLILNVKDSELEKIKGLDPESQIVTARLWGDKAKTIAGDPKKDDGYITLENNIKVLFTSEVEGVKYRTGNYWLIPTRSGEEFVWEADGEEPHGIDYYYCPLAIASYSSSGGKWEVEKDCRKVFPALTEVFRETAVMNGDSTIGTSLSLGVHSYNDSRRASDPEKAKHTDDHLDIQGGKQLKLNVGYWQDELGGTLPDVPDAAISFWVNDREKMRLTKDALTLDESVNIVNISKNLKVQENLTVEGTSHLQGVVSIGAEDPDPTIGLKVKPALSVPESGGSEIVGLKLEPTLTARNSGDELTGLHIKPEFKENSAQELKKYGLIVEQGKVGIGSALNDQGNISIGVDVRPEVSAKDEGDKLVGLHIKPNFDNSYQAQVERYGLMVEEGKVGIGSKALAREEDQDNLRVGVDVQPKVTAKDPDDRLVGLYIKPEFKECCGIDDGAKYGLIVEEGRVAFGPKVTPVEEGEEEYLVDIGTEKDSEGNIVSRLKVAGDLEVYGKVTYHAKKEDAGEIELGQQDKDTLLIHGKLETQHTSGKLKVTSPLEIELAGGDPQDFLSLFSTSGDETKGRIIWKKGTVKQDPYDEEAKEVAAIYSTTGGDGSDSSTGDLRFGTSDDGVGLTDRMVITADGNVGIGTDKPGTNQLKVTGTTTLETLVVENGLEVKGEDGKQYTEMVKLLLKGVATENQNKREENPTLKVKNGGVCIGADGIPKDDEKRDLEVEEIKLYVDGKVTFAKDLSVFGKAKVNTLNVKPKLKAIKDNSVLAAVEIEPSFDISIPESQVENKRVGDEFENVKRLGLHVVSGDVAIAAGGMAIGSTDRGTHKLKVTSGTTLLDGDLQVGESNIALKVNQKNQEVGIGGVSESNYKLAVAGATKIAGELEVVPSLSGASKAVEIKPKFTGSGSQTAVRIEPSFAGNGNTKFGLHVVKENVALCSASGGVAIGSEDPAGHKFHVTGGTTLLEGTLTPLTSNGGEYLAAAAITSTLTASANNQILTAVKIAPTWKESGFSGAKKLGLHVVGENVALCSASGGVAIGSDTVDGTHKLKVTGGTTLLEDTLTVSGPTSNLIVAQGKVAIGAAAVDGTHKLKVTGGTTTDNLAVSGKVAIGAAAVDGTHQLKVTGGTTILEGPKADLIVDQGKVAIGSAAVDGTHQLKVTGGTTTDKLAVSGNVAIGDDSNQNSGILFPKASKSKIKWNAKNNQNSDFAYIFFKENSKYASSRTASVGPLKTEAEVNKYNQKQTDGKFQFVEANDKVRLSIGVGDSVSAHASWQDTLDIQGAACLTLNVGQWDKELTEEIGSGHDHNSTPIGISFRVNDEQKMFIAPDGGVGIGKVPDTGNGVKLDVDGKIRTSDGILTNSDAKLKENIQLLKDGLGKILGLRGVTYKWKDGKEAAQKATEIGLVAQEVEDVFPELVSTDSQGMKSLSYSGLIAPLIEAVKEQQGQILELVQQVQQQQAHIEQLQALNNG